MENREIKLKVWDAESKVFLPTDDKNVYWNCTAGVLTAHLDRNGDWRQLEVIQFTGLSDKNGVEIYEGDILLGIGHYFKVGFKNGSFSAEYSDKEIDHYYLGNGTIEECEVIGNVYQNPELLK